MFWKWKYVYSRNMFEARTPVWHKNIVNREPCMHLLLPTLAASHTHALCKQKWSEQNEQTVQTINGPYETRWEHGWKIKTRLDIWKSWYCVWLRNMFWQITHVLIMKTFLKKIKTCFGNENKLCSRNLCIIRTLVGKRSCIWSRNVFVKITNACKLNTCLARNMSRIRTHARQLKICLTRKHGSNKNMF